LVRLVCLWSAQTQRGSGLIDIGGPVMISSVKGRCLINYNLNGGIATPPPLNVTPSVEQQCRDIRGDGPRQRPFPALPGAPWGHNESRTVRDAMDRRCSDRDV
jgi:hypothetical protein